MRKYIFFSSLACICVTIVHAQIVSKFTWEVTPVTTAVVGPNGISVSGSATSSAGGKSGSKGLNPGLPLADIVLTLTGTPTFDVANIDVSVDFIRQETQASFFKRGTTDFGISGGNLYANFNISNGAGGSTLISSGNVYAVPSDNTFHNYRFIYYNVLGKAQVLVDNVVVYAYNGTANRNLFWTAANNVVIGTQMDGNGTNITILDNFIVQPAPNAVLPLRLLGFSAKQVLESVGLEWKTSGEFACDGFDIERSADGIAFLSIKNIKATNNLTVSSYSEKDESPLGGKNYYRLKMLNQDGSFSYSSIVFVETYNSIKPMSAYWNASLISVFADLRLLPKGNYIFTLYSIDGRVIKNIQQFTGQQHFTSIPVPPFTTDRILLLGIMNAQSGSRRVIKVVRQH